jgi:hypothetical protein
MTDEFPSEPSEHEFGSSTVIIHYGTAEISAGAREFLFRIKRMGIVLVYRQEVSRSEVDHLDGRELAEYLLIHARHKSLLWAYRE